MEGPVVVQVPAGPERAQAEDGFGSPHAPAGSRDVQAVDDEVAAGALNDARGDGQPVAKVAVVMEHAPLCDEVVRAVIDALSLLGGKPALGGATADAARHLARPSLQDREGPLRDPLLGLLVALGEEAPGRVPYVLEHVEEIDDERADLRLPATLHLGANAGDLLWVAVHEHHPAAPALRVAAASLLE